MRIYLAGPLGFSESGQDFVRKLASMLEDEGHEVLDPFALTEPAEIEATSRMPYGPAKRERWKHLNEEIGANNAVAIDRSDALLAVLDGPDVDSGTAAEIGYAFAHEKRIIGYRNDFRLAADNEGAVVNLQVEHFIRKSGGTIVKTLAEIPDALARPVKTPVRAISGAPVATGRPGRFSGPEPFTTGKDRGAHIVLVIILALAVRAALEALFVPALNANSWAIVTPLQWAQAGVFFIMTWRFYLGARRYVSTEPKHLHLLSKSVNITFAFALFCTFYATALAVARPGSFFTLIVFLHVVDILWFVIALACTWRMPTDRVEPGEITKSASFRIALTFLLLSLATIIFAFLNYGMFRSSIHDPGSTPAHWSFLSFLLFLSVLDFVVLRDYYFRFESWRARNAVEA